MDFSSLWKHCYRFTHASFHTYVTIRGLPLSAVSRCRCFTCQDICVQHSHVGFPFSDLKQTQIARQKNPYSYNKNPERLRYEQKHMSGLIWIKTKIEYWFNYSSSSKFSSAIQTFNIWTTFLLLKTFFHNAGNILRWWYLSRMPPISRQSWTPVGWKIPQKIYFLMLSSSIIEICFLICMHSEKSKFTSNSK